MKDIRAKIYLPSKVVFGYLRGFVLKIKKILFAVLLYTILILMFSFLYKAVYISSVLKAKEVLEKRAKETSWIVAIRLYQLTELEQNNIKNNSLTWKSSMSLEGIKENLAFVFSEAEDFLIGADKFGAEITVTAYLSRGGGPISKYGAPFYHLYTVYFWSPKYARRNNSSEDSTPESNRFYGTRSPYEWAPPGVFDNPYQLPFKIVTSEKSKIFSVTSPRSVFLEECAEEIEMYLENFIAEEIDKWLKIGSLSNFLYFSCTFGLGNIAPNSERVRQLVIFQAFIGTVILVILIPTLLGRREKRLD